MINPRQIKNQLALRPFRVFWIETIGGNRIRVTRPDWFFEPPDSMGEFIIFGDGVIRVLNYAHILDNITVEGPPRLEKQPE
jgi:hypothetical protein